jgi:hypothetical protein
MEVKSVRLWAIGDGTIEIFEGHGISTATMRRSVERYLLDIHSIILVISAALPKDATYTATMMDGTRVRGRTRETDGTVMEFVPRRTVRRPEDLITAIEQDDMCDVEDAIGDGVDVNSMSVGRVSALAAAAMTGSDNTSVLEYLLDLPGINVDDVDSGGDPVLHGAIYFMSVKALTEFARRGAALYTQDGQGRSILHIAMEDAENMADHIAVLMTYAPILTLCVDREGCLPGESELVRPARENMMARVTEMIDCVIPIRAMSRLVLSYYTRI